MTKISEKISATLFGTVLAAALFLYLYLRHGYVFPFIEQNRMFLWDGGWVLRRMAECGGTAAVARDFVLQFFIEPWSGALITALLLAAVGVTMRRTLERVAADNGAWLLWLAPVAAQIFLTVDYDYRYEGFLSWLAAWGLFSIMVRAGGTTALRVAAATALSVVLYWLAGPAAIAFAVTLFVYEAMRGHKRWWYLLPVAAALAMALAAYGRGWYGTLARAFTPEAYWNPMVPASPWVWAAWVAMPVAVAVVRPLAALRRRAGTILRRGVVVMVQAAAVAVIAVAAAHGERYYMQQDTRLFERLDYLMRRGAWDDVIATVAASGGENTLHCFMLNTALLERGELAARAFTFPQRGLEGLSIDWSDNNPFLFPLLSDMYYAVGNVSIAQETAFKKNSEALAVNGSCNPRMLLRLVQTFLAGGGRSGHAAAEKYISMLEHTLFYRDAASVYRRMVGDDGAVAADARLGAERENMSNIAVVYAAERDASQLSRLKPNALVGRTVEHLLTGRLLNRDLEGFRAAVEGCRTAGVMPAAECFEEALLIYGAMTGRDMSGYDISEQTRRRFLAFQSFAAENYARSDLAALMRRNYGGTYMYYFMFAGEEPAAKR